MADDPKYIPPIGIKRVRTKRDAFCKFIEDNKSKRFCICAHDNPDPDALASAFGIAWILEFLGVESLGIYYCGEISHPQNRAMNNVLNIPAKQWNEQIEDELGKEDLIHIFVDCVGNQRNMSIKGEPHIAIDHHKNVAGKNVLFIHDEIGSCSTLVLELMLSIPPIDGGEDGEKSYCFDPDADGIKGLATALAVGIKTDTLDFRNETTTEHDFKAYKLLSKFVSDDKFHKIVNYELPPYMFDAEEIAWKNRNQQTPNLITGLGFVDKSRGDSIPYLADKMMRLQGIQTVVVYAIIENSIRGSVRTVSAAFDAQKLTDDIFGAGNGGAKHGIGGAKVDFNVFNTSEMNEDQRNILWELTKTSIEGKFQEATQK